MPETDFIFTDNSDAAYRETINRNVAGARLSQRLWSQSRANQRNVNEVIEDSVRNGRAVTAAGKKILETTKPDVEIPKYVRELEAAATKARALSDSSILQKEIAKYKTYINSLTRGLEPEEVRKRYAHLGMRGASRMLVKRLSSANEEVYSAAVDKWVGRKASYHARVVARNETNEAHHRALIGEVQDKPYVTALKWELGSHPKRDICDTLHTQDIYGLGPGRYPKDAVPARPHPN